STLYRDQGCCICTVARLASISAVSASASLMVAKRSLRPGLLQPVSGAKLTAAAVPRVRRRKVLRDMVVGAVPTVCSSVLFMAFTFLLVIGVKERCAYLRTLSSNHWFSSSQGKKPFSTLAS